VRRSGRKALGGRAHQKVRKRAAAASISDGRRRRWRSRVDSRPREEGGPLVARL
jgi:hypothetical protein